MQIKLLNERCETALKFPCRSIVYVCMVLGKTLIILSPQLPLPLSYPNYCEAPDSAPLLTPQHIGPLLLPRPEMEPLFGEQLRHHSISLHAVDLQNNPFA